MHRGMDCYDAMNLDETTLTLGLVGGVNRGSKLAVKRVFSETIDLSLGRGSSEDGDGKVAKASDARHSDAITSKPPLAKKQVIGWPPIKLPRKNNAITKSCKFVKVAVDGAPYLRKIDLETYNSYEQLLEVLENMFSCFTNRKDSRERKLIMDPASGGKYIPTYEDKDEDWMFVGDVPWETFVNSCKRIRLMKSSEEIKLAASRGSVSTCKSLCSCPKSKIIDRSRLCRNILN